MEIYFKIMIVELDSECIDFWITFYDTLLSKIFVCNSNTLWIQTIAG
jgi:hypothetical protein